MSWRNRISWRWIIRGTCLGLLGLCVAVWGLSYFYSASFQHGGSYPCLGGSLYRGAVHAEFHRYAPYAPGWYGFWSLTRPRDRALTPNGYFLGFIVRWRPGESLVVQIPLWLPTLLLAGASWIAWRKTGRGKTAQGFPVEPLASRRDSDGG